MIPRVVRCTPSTKRALLFSTTARKLFEVNTVHEIATQIQLLDLEGGVCGSDLDETIFATFKGEPLGSSKWFEANMKEKKQIYDDPNLAFQIAIQEYHDVQNHINVRPVEGSDTTDFMHKLHTKHDVVYVTARGREIADATERHLNATGIPFNLSPKFKDRFIDLSSYSPNALARKCVVYANGANKLPSLKGFFVTCNYINFDFLIGIDDKLSNLNDLAEVARYFGKPSYLFRYGALDNIHSKFDLEVTDLQREWLKRTGELINYNKASAMLATNINKVRPRVV